MIHALPYRPRRHLRAPLLMALTIGLLSAACSATRTNDLARVDSATRPDAGATPGAAPNSSGELKWSSCTNDLAVAVDLQCATLAVPLDPAKPDGTMIDLELARSSSTGTQQERIGSLLFNPGGPGGSGIEFLAGASPTVPTDIHQHFDLVSWDPRGVGESSPVECLDDHGKDAQIEGDLSPDTPAEFDRAVKDQKELREACESNNAEILRHMSTADVAADLDRIREAVGDKKLNYVGFSYGTAIGATYATEYPDRVRAMVLDGAVSPKADPIARDVAQAQGFERTYLSFIADCEASNDCALRGTAASAVEAARSRLDTQPMKVNTSSGQRELTRDLFDVGLATALYDTSLWGMVARAVADLDHGGATVMLALADRQVGRKADGTWDNSSDVQNMVNCADSDYRPNVEQAEKDSEKLRASSPTFGEAFAAGSLSCIDWPKALDPIPEWTAEGAPPILVIGTVGDPATPYEWAQQMNATLNGSTLLTYEGEGHTAFMRGGPCIDDAVSKYLIDLVVPPPGTRCPAQDRSTDFGSIKGQLTKELSDAGIPASLSTCIAEGMIAEDGESALDLLLLEQDIQAQTDLVTRISRKCMAGG